LVYARPPIPAALVDRRTIRLLCCPRSQRTGVSVFHSSLLLEVTCSSKIAAQLREEIKDAIKLEEARRAAMVKNLYRLRSLRLSRNQASTQSKK
jgi:hypothetical protein